MQQSISSEDTSFSANQEIPRSMESAGSLLPLQ
jgi:hypothetical protein